MRTRPLHPAAVLGALTACFAALFAVFIAAIAKSLIYETVCRNGLMTAQLIVAIAGLVPVGALFVAAVRGHRGLAFLTFILSVITYIAWGVLNDAAVHGWGNLKVF